MLVDDALPAQIRSAARFCSTSVSTEAIAGITVSAQLFGHTLLNLVLSTVGPTVVSLAVLLEVPGALLFALVLLGQVPPLLALPGVALVVIGVALVVREVLEETGHLVVLGRPHPSQRYTVGVTGKGVPYRAATADDTSRVRGLRIKRADISGGTTGARRRGNPSSFSSRVARAAPEEGRRCGDDRRFS